MSNPMKFILVTRSLLGCLLNQPLLLSSALVHQMLLNSDLSIQTSGLLSIVIGRAGALQGICAFCVSMKDNRPTIKSVGRRSTDRPSAGQGPATTFLSNNDFRPARVSRSDLLKASFGDLI